MYRVWTDGSGIATGSKHTGLGIVLQHGTAPWSPVTWEVHASYLAGPGTHNVAELKAIALGLRLPHLHNPIIRRLKDGVPPVCAFFDNYIGKNREPILLISDSEYALYSTSGKFNGSKNLKLIGFCRQQAKLWKKLKYQHVHGHSNQRENEMADELAGRARQCGEQGQDIGFKTLDVFLMERKVLTLISRFDEQGRWELTVPKS